MFKLKYRYHFAFLLSLYTFLNTEFCKVYYYFHLQIEWYYAFATILLITFSILELNRLIDPVISKFFPPEKNKIKYQIAFFISGNILATTFTVAIVLAMGMGIHDFTFKGNIVPLKLNLMYCWLVNLLYHLINTIIYYFQEYKSSSLQAEKLKNITAQAELQLIKNQINPHFLFNNLNVLSTLILKDNQEANKFIEEFSKVYRYILSNHDKELVELSTELEFIKPYIFLLEKRFGDGLSIQIDIAEKYKNYFIIPASLQMLIENAIKHNIVSRSKPLKIDMHSNGSNTLVISNNIQEKQTIEKSTGIGLQNIVKRYNLVCEQNVLIDKNHSKFTVVLPLLPTKN